MTSSQMLRAAIDLVKAGNKDQARLILSELLKRDPENEAAYFWYVDALESDEERLMALLEFIKVKPNHERAKNALLVVRDRLSAAAPVAPSQPVSDPVEPLPLPEKKEAPPEQKKTAEKKPEKQRSKTAAPDTMRMPPSIKGMSQRKEGFFSRLLKALLVLVMISLCCVSIVYPMIRDSALLNTPQQLYAKKMTTPVDNIDRLVKGSIAEWDKALNEIVYAGNSATYRDMLYFNMKMGYSDVLITRRLSPLVYDISRQGGKIIETMQTTQPPAEIATAHAQVLACMQYEVEWSTTILQFLESNTPPKLSEDTNQCGNFKAAFEMLRQYIKIHSQPAQ